MSKLTAEQIETTITQSHADILAVLQISQDPRVVDPCVTRELRACFTAGQDHGQSVILERAASLMGDNVASATEAQMGRTVITIMNWVSVRKGRQFTGFSFNSASVLLCDDELVDGFHFHYVYADSPGEALSKLATWCTEHAQANPPPAPAQSDETRDTEPPPASASSL